MSETPRHRPDNELLRVTRISKRFGETQALRGVDLGGMAGEVHAIVGENGAGKSTLLKIMSGAEQPDTGQIWIDGQPMSLRTPLDAYRLGIWAVYQEFSLVPHLSVAENILLGRLASQGRLVVDPKEIRSEAQDLLDELGFSVEVGVRVDHLDVSQRQMVEIAKGIAERPRILVLDEPSAVLSRAELEHVFALIRRSTSKGTLVFYVSHRLDEVFEIADRITVLIDGEHVATVRPTEVDQRGLISMMVGRSIEDVYPQRESPVSPPVRLAVEGLGRGEAFSDVTFELGAGEVVGLFGLVGSGRTEVARAIFGAEPATAGRMTLDGHPYAPQSPSEALDARVAYLTEDRRRDGLLPRHSVRRNMSLAVIRAQAKLGFVDRRREADDVASQMHRLQVRARGPETLVDHLSGGNQQKVLLSRWLLTESRVLVLDEPTRGVDVPTKIEIYRTIARLAAGGTAILLISSELVEILGMSDRILVMRRGTLVAEQRGSDATEQSLLAAAAGVAA
ncbi:MAG: sugar ABC transporter ATP-binding protein [Acidimicrobiia bacterium]